jgi:sensor histidine kinase YesM
MKKILVCLVLFISCLSFAQQEKLPEFPWKEIVEIELSTVNSLKKWETDIKVSLEGNYNKEDSLLVAKYLQKLDSITETISIGFSNSKNSNFKIIYSNFYLEKDTKITYNRKAYKSSAQKQGIFNAEFVIHQMESYNETAKKTLEVTLAKSLIDGYYRSTPEDYEYSIFKKRHDYRNKDFSLNKSDLAIIEEIYKKGFEEKYILAENQFKNKVEKEIKRKKWLNRDRSLWYVKNPISLIILPLLILGTLFLIVTIKINSLIASIVQIPYLQFMIVSLIGLFFLGVLIIFSVSLFDFLTIPYDYSKVPYVRKNTIRVTLVAMMALFSYLIFFRFMELKIRESSQNILLKTGWIFLSTGFLPFLMISAFAFFILSKKGIQSDQEDYTVLSYIFVIGMMVASIRALISYFIFKERNLIIENENKLSHLRELNAKAELKSLQSQINPHFLYNSLNSIASLAPVDADKTQKMAHSLSDLFKYSINRKGKKMSTVKDEIEMVTSYLDIEKIRFGNRLQFDIQVDKTLLNHEIPLFLIQPLVENAVKHGISQNEGDGKIILIIEKELNQLLIKVSDNGPDFPEGLVSGHGLQTVYDLLRLSYGDNASLNWTNTPEKIITIAIPDTV